MLDFLMISTRSSKRDTVEIYPKFIIKKSSDLMIRGSDFYAIWDEDKHLWSTDEQEVIRMVDSELDQYAKENRLKIDGRIRVLHMWDAETGIIDKWHKYCQKQMRDSFHMLDEKVIFENEQTEKTDYASKKLPYPLLPGDCSAYDELMSVLYSAEERRKIEWAVGSVINGDSKKIQKFLVLYGAAGTGKSTVLNIIQQLFEGYCGVFDAKALGSSNNSFALESFKSNPLVAIQHDGDLSRIEDNTRLNSLVSHEMMTVNEKFRSAYSNQFKSFLFMGTNKPVRITDAKSGLIRRLIDVSPTGDKVSQKRYSEIVGSIKFELGAIAYHCKDVYESNPSAYDGYIPISMLGASNDFYNYVMDSYDIFKDNDGTTLKAAWEAYKAYCDDAKVTYPYNLRVFKEELKNYFKEFRERAVLEDETRVRNYYSGFKFKIGYFIDGEDAKDRPAKHSLQLDENIESAFDKLYAECPAQYANAKTETPSKRWDDVKTRLCDLDTKRMHYVLLPNKQHIFMDFDLKDEDGNKSLEKNIEAARLFPPTYAELSKGGHGIHLHYIYEGDSSKLNNVYSEGIEIKVPSGKSALRRKLTKCNNLPIATINSGLPLKGEKKMVNIESVKSENGLRNMIRRNLKKEFHPGTKPSIDFIDQILQEAYDQGLSYDVSDMRPAVMAFAANSTHQSLYCIKKVDKMKFRSELPAENVEIPDPELIFLDTEVFPNLFLVEWKAEGEGKSVVRMINPTPEEVERLLTVMKPEKGKPMGIVTFNGRRYDMLILYARAFVTSPTTGRRGYTNADLYQLSQDIIAGKATNVFREAPNFEYTDVFDFSSKKQSLKKFEIELDIPHQEIGLPWDIPVPEELWEKVAEYCENDVRATEAVFHSRKADFVARQILADVGDMTVNDTTNSLTTKIIFGANRKPQDAFQYRDLAAPCKGKPYFPGYVYDAGKSTYRGEEVGEGGYVYAEPGMYGNIALLDIASMHPSSIIAENLFGDVYTARYKEILDARIAIKHKDFDKAKKMLGGKLEKYLTDEESSAALAQALKIAINSVYGLTSARFENPFRDIRNKDNIVAKRGALFMVDLKHAVQERGYTVAHIKTDSIKIPDATPEIIQFVIDFGHQYGYNFEHEATYERMCLVNDAVYIAKYATVEQCEALYGSEYVHKEKDILKDCKKEPGKWTATGTQFAVPYVFKTIFSKEEIEFKDLCETKSVSSALYLDMNEGLPEDEHNYQFIGKVGQFCPIKEGCGGGVLLREKDGKYYAATGSKGFRWMESEIVKKLNKMNDIDRAYYDDLVTEAVHTLVAYGDYEWFISDEPYEYADAPFSGAKIINKEKING